MSIADELDREFAEAWKPSPGDKLIGVVTVRNTRVGGPHGDYEVITVRQDDGEELAWHASVSVSRRKVEEDDPQPGDKVGVKYRGLVQSKAGANDYHDYALVVERGADVPRGGGKPPADDSIPFAPCAH